MANKVKYNLGFNSARIDEDKNYQVPEIIIDTITKLLKKQSQDKIIFPLQEV